VLEKTLGVPLFQEQVMRLAVVAADYTPGEADQLRRDMAAWRKDGRIEAHRDKLIGRMVAKGIAPEFAERVFQQIRGFGEYGFPESHAASFALISYAGAWFKRHHPAVFACALLNAQPMGFYSVASIVEDARRHGVEVRAVDALRSQWNCSLEPAAGGPALRMGLRQVKGLGEAAGRRVAAAVQERSSPPRSPRSIDELRERAGLDRRELQALAEAGALEGLERGRRAALWRAQAPARARDLYQRDGGDGEPAPAFAPLSEAESIGWDWARTGHSARGHPLGPRRAELRAQGLADARAVSALADGAPVRCAGLVICRQRPATASGITFMTLEDETGFVNLIVKPRVLARFAPLIQTESFLGVRGTVQAERGVVHVLARRFWRPRLAARLPEAESHDYC
jgi:error-prone DNA polymerase